MPKFGIRWAAILTANISVLGAGAQTITSIGVLPGDTISKINAMSAAGDIVVGWSRTASTNGTAIHWSTVSPISAIGYLPGGSYSTAYGLSPNATVIVGSANDPNGLQAFVQPLSFPMGALAAGPSIIQQAAATGVDATGANIVGTYSVLAGFGVYPRAALWTSSGLTTLTAAAGSIASVASKITPSGQYIIGDFGPGVGMFGNNYNPIARIWSSPTTWSTIGTLPGGTWSTGVAISDNGQAATGSADNGVASQRAYRWSLAFGMEDLGPMPTAPATTGWSRGYAITPDGLVVVGDGAIDATLSNRGAMFSTVNGLVNLNTYLPTVGVNLAGWNLWEATGVSADGTAICGNGAYLGQERGWVVRGIPAICAPSIYSQPQPTAFCAGNFGFVQVLANPPHWSINLHFQWYQKVGHTNVPVGNGYTFGGSFISGAQSAFLSFNPGYGDVAGNYFCVVSGGCSDTATSIVSVSVNTAAPIPWPNPLPLSICPPGGGGWIVTGQVAAQGPYTHQWYFESPVNSNNWLPLVDGPTALSFGVQGGIVSGSSTSSFTIVAAPNKTLKLAHSTRYRCRVFNSCTFTDSPPGVLAICIGDDNCDGVVDDSDFVDFAGAYDIFDCADPLMPPGCPADMNGDGYVDDVDFVLFANAYDNFVCP